MEPKAQQIETKSRRSPVAYVRTSEGGEPLGPMAYHDALRRARLAMVELLAKKKGEGWQRISATVFRRRLTLEVELAVYVVDGNGLIKRRFPSQKVKPAEQFLEEPTSNGRQLTIQHATAELRRKSAS